MCYTAVVSQLPSFGMLAAVDYGGLALALGCALRHVGRLAYTAGLDLALSVGK